MIYKANNRNADVSNFIEKIAVAIDICGSGSLIVHSNVMKAMKAIKLTTNAYELLNNHIEALEYCASSRSLWIPTFNYQFPKTKFYDVESSKSEVGQLSEFARLYWADWRTQVPIYSFCGKGEKPQVDEGSAIHPFGRNSVFSEIVKNDGVVLHYGTTINTTTIVHHVEEMLDNGPLYRYQKMFSGVVKKNDCSDKKVVIKNFVRPLNKYLEYDWEKIQGDLIKENILHKVNEGASFAYVFSARKMFEYLTHQMMLDQCYLIDDKSKSWLKPMINHLGRRIEQADFEK